MVVNKRKKVGKYRAHTTHGGGHRKKRRGAGSRGGRGNAGTGKRAGQKKAGISRVLGKKGFTSKRAIGEDGINLVRFTTKMVNGLLEKGKITKDGDVFVLNLNKLGYQKLLGTGTTNLKLRVTVNNCSASAEKKIVAAGGEVIKTKKAAKTGKATEKESGKETVVEKVNKKEQPEKDNQEEN